MDRRLRRAVVLEEPGWARAALTIAHLRASEGRHHGIVAWRLGPDEVVGFGRGKTTLSHPFRKGRSAELGMVFSTWHLARNKPEDVLPLLTGERAATATRSAALVTAWQDDGVRTLIDLVNLSSTAIDAPMKASGISLSDAIVELAGRIWSDLDELVLVGFGKPIPALGKVTYIDDVSAAEEMLRLEVSRRASEPNAPPLARCIVVPPGLPASGRRSALSTLIAVLEQVPGNCLLCCDSTAPVRAVWHLDADKHARVLEVRQRTAVVARLWRPARLPVQPLLPRWDDETDDEAEADPKTEPDLPFVEHLHWASRSADPDPAQTGAGETVVRVCLLGPVEVLGTAIDISRRPTATQLLVYLAVHPEGATGEEMVAAVWPERRLPMQSFANRLSEARRALGRRPDGSARLVRRAGRHVLTPDVSSDLAEFRELTRPGASPEEWKRGLRLIRGRPFQGLPSDWAVFEGFTAAVTRELTDAGLRISSALLAREDFLGADWAAWRAIIVDPHDERLYCQIMRVSYAAGNPKGVETALLALAAARGMQGDPLTGVHPTTAELYRRLTS